MPKTLFNLGLELYTKLRRTTIHDLSRVKDISFVGVTGPSSLSKLTETKRQDDFVTTWVSLLTLPEMELTVHYNNSTYPVIDKSDTILSVESRPLCRHLPVDPFKNRLKEMLEPFGYYVPMDLDIKEVIVSHGAVAVSIITKKDLGNKPHLEKAIQELSKPNRSVKIIYIEKDWGRKCLTD